MNFEGKLVGTDLKVAIVVSRFNDFITNRLLDGAKRYTCSSWCGR